MTEYLDLALDYLKDHKLIAASVALLFLVLLIRNFWFIIKLMVILLIGGIVVFLAYSFIADTVKSKKDLLNEPESNLILPDPSQRAKSLNPIRLSGLTLPDRMSRFRPCLWDPFPREKDTDSDRPSIERIPRYSTFRLFSLDRS